MIQFKIRKNRYLWKAPAAVNFFLGGLGAGLFILNWMTGTGVSQEGASVAQNYIALISALLVLFGFVAVSLEAGRPMRGIYVFLNFATAWMSREVILGWVFVLFCIAHYFSQADIVGLLAAICAGLFIFSQAMVLYRSLAVKSWHTILIPALIISADLCAGYGAGMLLGLVSTSMLLWGIALIGLHIFISTLYALHSSTQSRTTYGVQPPISQLLLRKDILILWFPFVMSLILLLGVLRDNAFFTAVCGGLLVFGVAYKIYSIVCKTVSLRPMAIEKPIPKSFC